MGPVLFDDCTRLKNALWNLRLEPDVRRFEPVFNALVKALRSGLPEAEAERVLAESGSDISCRALRNYAPASSWAILKGSVLEARADAVVNAASPTLLGGGGVDGAIHRAAGPKLRKACALLGGCPPGEVRATGAYGLKNTQIIIHAVGPMYQSLENDAPALRSAYKKSLGAARELGAASIAFPCISAGAYGFPLAPSAETALESVTSWQAENAGYALDVYFCCFTEAEYATYLGLAKSI